MAYTIKAIETRYKGHFFRSRLEARYAAFFDLLEWDWVYEPFDLAGWVPDFLLVKKKSKGLDVLVEVKGPLEEVDMAVEKALMAMCSAKQTWPCIFPTHLGPHASDYVPWECSIGRSVFLDLSQNDLMKIESVCNNLYETVCSEEWGMHLRDGPCGLMDLRKEPLALCVDICESIWGSWEGYLSGWYDGNNFLGMELKYLQNLWGKSHEATRWTPNKGRK